MSERTYKTSEGRRASGHRYYLRNREREIARRALRSKLMGYKKRQTARLTDGYVRARLSARLHLPTVKNITEEMVALERLRLQLHRLICEKLNRSPKGNHRRN